MKGELKIQRDPTRRKFRCPVWTVTLFAWEFPLDKFRKRVVAAIRKMDGFVGIPRCSSMKMTEGCFILHFLIARHMQKLQEI